MDALEAIRTRRSIRKYTAEPVTDQQVETLLRAAMSAPSSYNSQPWEFVVIRDRGLLDEIPKVHKYAQMLSEAPLAILVCADLQRQNEPDIGFWIQDCAAATQNVLLAARALGLGTCWIGIHPRELRKAALRRMCRLPEEIMPFGLIAVGHAAEEKGPAERFEPGRIHCDRW